jgi:hypothetical protein
VTDYRPGFLLDQAMGVALSQDWTYDFDDAYAAMEAWFQRNGGHPDVLNGLVRDVDLLFAETSDVASRLARFPQIGWRLETFDAFLQAIRKRAVDGIAGDPEPMRAP